MQAAKMTPYEVDIHEKVIYVPENELAEAEDDLAVNHLRNGYGFHIQSCIPEATEKKEVFNPTTTQKVLVRKEAEISAYKVGQMFESTSTGAILSIVRTESKKVELTYLSYDERLAKKPNWLCSNEQLETSLRKGILKPYQQ